MEKSKTIWRILLHLLFWAGFFYIFVVLNFFRPYPFYHPYKEWVIGAVIMAACYATYFWTVPKFYLNGFTKKFFLVSLAGCLLLTVFEMAFLWNDIMPFAKQRPDLLTIYMLQMFVMILLRNGCLFGLFFILKTNRYYALELHKINTRHIAESSRLNITVQGNNTVQVPLNDIVYIRHQKNYSYFYLTDGKTLCQYISLSKIEESIPANTFVRINKSTLANMKHIVQTSVKDKTVTTSLADPQTGEAVTLNLSPVFADSVASLLINKGSIE